jgi:serine/threonine protein kinase
MNSEFTAGERCGDYELLAYIGRGGMAQVWSARHVHTGELVAIKALLHNYAGNAVLQERLSREGQSQKALDHPNILRAQGTFLWNGSHMMVMELVDGESLEHYLQRRRLMPVPEVRGVAQAVLSALEHAHSNSIVHRDVKPSNILLSRKGRILLGDFGIALLQNATRLTRLGSMGTPAYMSPEQIVGKDIDHRTDIYSVGCVLYELLTGTPPFSADGADANDVVRDAHRFQPVEPLTARNPSVSPVLEKVVLKALEKRPSDRYESCAAFAAALGVSIQWKNSADAQKNSGDAPKVYAAAAGVTGPGRGAPSVEIPRAGTPVEGYVEAKSASRPSLPRVHFPGSTPASAGFTVARPSIPSEPKPSSQTLSALKHPAATGKIAIGAAVLLTLVSLWMWKRASAPAPSRQEQAKFLVDSKGQDSQQAAPPPSVPKDDSISDSNTVAPPHESAGDNDARAAKDGISTQFDQMRKTIETLKKQAPQADDPAVNPAPSSRPAPLAPPPVASRRTSGVLDWTGAKGPVVIEGGAATAGVLKGDPLPGVPVRLWIEGDNGAITQLPSAADAYQHLDLNMKSNHVRIHWDALGGGQGK